MDRGESISGQKGGHSTIHQFSLLREGLLQETSISFNTLNKTAFSSRYFYSIKPYFLLQSFLMISNKFSTSGCHSVCVVNWCCPEKSATKHLPPQKKSVDNRASIPEPAVQLSGRLALCFKPHSARSTMATKRFFKFKSHTYTQMVVARNQRGLGE